MTGPNTPGPSMSPPAQNPGRDWTDQAADAIESVVLSVKQKTTVPLTTIARAIVYGVVIAALGTVALVLAAVSTVRVLTVYLPVGRVNDGRHRVWVADLIVGGIFTLAGLFLWSKRTSKAGVR
ncbi:MAG: hypothetical protein NVS3B12_15490 [Acidimicrobiales bacterium]